MGAILLELDLTISPAETPPTDPLAALANRRRPVLRDLLEGVRLATSDPDVVGLVAHIGGAGPALAQAQELAEAVGRFAASGKPTIAWSESFGELGPATVPYLLASAFGEIWLQPSGDVGLTGIVAEAVFVADALTKLGVVPQMSARREYKTAVDTFTATEMSEAHRESAGRLAESAMDQVVRSIADARGLPQDRLREVIDSAPVSASDASDLGLVDRLGYRDQVYAELRQRLGHPRLQYVHRYRRARQLRPDTAMDWLRRRPAVALVHARGDIHLGRGTKRGLGSASVGSDSLGALLRATSADPAIRAVVLRIDSPGGSYIASDAIRREVLRVRESGRPVIASMGPVAASGGYFIAMAADVIVALPGTLTGSIGVFGGKAVVRDLLDRVGVAIDGVARGANARMFSTYRRFSDEEWQRLETWLDRVYADFTGKVADDRSLPSDDAEAAAKGRVWTGADARGLGLVDELGGLERAIELACARSGLDRDAVEVRTVPRLGLLERFRSPDSSEDLPAAAARASRPDFSALLGRSVADGPVGIDRPLQALATALGVPPIGVLTAPVLWDLH